MESELASVVANNDLARTRSLLADKDATGVFGTKTLLHLARSAKMVNLLLDKGAVIDAPAADTGASPLLEALLLHAHKVAFALLARGASTKATDKDGDTALHILAWFKGDFVPLLDALVEKGADVDAINSQSKTPLIVAAEVGNELVATNLLLKHGARPNLADRKGITPLMYALRSRLFNLTHELLKRGANVNAIALDGNTALHAASMVFNANLLAQLMRNAVEIDKINKRGETPLNTAAATGNYLLLWFLLERDVNINAADDHGRTALHRAAFVGDPESVTLLLGKGATPDLRDKTETTPFGYAIRRRNIAVIKILLDAGVGVQLAPSGLGINDTPLVKMLLANDVPPNTPLGSGETPLVAQVHNRNAAAITALVHAGADVNHRDEQGNTALHEAVRADYAGIVQILLKYGADVSIENDEGITPQALAELMGLSMLASVIAHFAVDKTVGEGFMGLVAARTLMKSMTISETSVSVSMHLT